MIPQRKPDTNTAPTTTLPYAEPEPESTDDALHMLLDMAEEQLPPAIAALFQEFDNQVESGRLTIDSYEDAGDHWRMELNGIITVTIPKSMHGSNPANETRHRRFLALFLADLHNLEEVLDTDGVAKIRRCVICGYVCCNIGPFDYIQLRV